MLKKLTELSIFASDGWLIRDSLEALEVGLNQSSFKISWLAQW
jgi:hypothetical protein